MLTFRFINFYTPFSHSVLDLGFVVTTEGVSESRLEIALSSTNVAASTLGAVGKLLVNLLHAVDENQTDDWESGFLNQ